MTTVPLPPLQPPGPTCLFLGLLMLLLVSATSPAHSAAWPATPEAPAAPAATDPAKCAKSAPSAYPPPDAITQTIYSSELTTHFIPRMAKVGFARQASLYSPYGLLLSGELPGVRFSGRTSGG